MKPNKYTLAQAELQYTPRTWLVTGAAGFIGSNLVEALLKLDQNVVGLDNFTTGNRGNLEDVRSLVRPEQWARFKFREGDICQLSDCRDACAGVNYVLHQAALGSVPRSIVDPIRSHTINVDGFVNMVIAARDAKVERFIYASSSSVYGDHPALPKVESNIGEPMSPYATTKLVNEIYAKVIMRCYGLHTIGLRYFNVFGRRQDPSGAYAAVIPKWIAAILQGDPVQVNGDGQASRDFCFVANVVQANILAAVAPAVEVYSSVFNIAVGRQTTLTELISCIEDCVRMEIGSRRSIVRYGVARQGDVRHSLADISRAEKELGYCPTHTLVQGLAETRSWYARRVNEAS